MKKESSGEGVKVTKYETNLKEAHQRVPNIHEKISTKERDDEDASVQTDTSIHIRMTNTQTNNDFKVNNHASAISTDQENSSTSARIAELFHKREFDLESNHQSIYLLYFNLEN